MRHAAKLAFVVIALIAIGCTSTTGPSTHDTCSGGTQQWDRCTPPPDTTGGP